MCGRGRNINGVLVRGVVVGGKKSRLVVLLEGL